MKTAIPYTGDISVLKAKALQWAASFEAACYFDSNQYPDAYGSFDVLIAAGARAEVCSPHGKAFDKLSAFLSEHTALIPGFLAYDLKNELEDLGSANPDPLEFPDLYFFVPEHLILIRGNRIEIESTDEAVLTTIERVTLDSDRKPFTGAICSKFSRDSYIETVNAIKHHIARGDIYELNFCQEFYAEKAAINPLYVYKELNSVSPVPFSCFFKHKNHFLLCASPERFLCRRGDKLISQPIKGTAARSNDKEEDNRLKQQLRNDEKEQSENVMIVDLVRNDLTRCAVPGSVKVEEIFGIYTFRQVHQMISTVVCLANPDFTNTGILKAAFPMGSMTGAPKVRAMELIEQYEKSKRGLFSGAVGYFGPEGDFDFNVVIRSLFYNKEKQYLSFQVGSAITFASDAQKEYEECMLKAKAIFKVLTGS